MNDTLKVPDIGNPSVLDSGTAFQPHRDPIELPPSVTGERRIESKLADRKRAVAQTVVRDAERPFPNVL